MKTFTQRQIDLKVEAVIAKADKASAAGKSAELDRRQEISALGRGHDSIGLANDAICDGVTVEEFRNSEIPQ